MKVILYLLTIALISSMGCKNINTPVGSNGSIDSIETTVEEEQSNQKNIHELTCDELTELVKNDGNRIDNLSSGELDSEMLYNVDLYEFNDIYYLIADFQRGGTYIYCDVNMGAWSRFKDNDYDSYGRSFHAYIAKDFICDCD